MPGFSGPPRGQVQGPDPDLVPGRAPRGLPVGARQALVTARGVARIPRPPPNLDRKETCSVGSVTATGTVKRIPLPGLTDAAC